MRIGIVWENGVSKWMSQMFEPLMEMEDVDIRVFVGERNKFDVSDVLLEKEYLTHRGEIVNAISLLPDSMVRIFKNPYRRMDFYYNSLRRYLKGYHIVECHDSSRSLYTLADLKKIHGFKLVVSYAENIPYRQVFDEKTNYIKHHTCGMIDHFIPWCDTIKRVMILEGIPEEKITTIYTGLDLNLFNPAPKDTDLLREYRIEEDSFIILYIGKIVSWKGVHSLAYVARILRYNGYKRFCFLVAGRGAQMKNLKRIIKEADVEGHFRFIGFVPYTEIQRLYNLADLFVLPSYPAMTWQEQFGMVLVEAMACGRPVVSTDSGSIPEIVGDAGMIVPPGDFFTLAEKIALFMDNRQLLDEFGRKGRKRVERLFDARKNAKRLYEVYRKVLGDS